MDHIRITLWWLSFLLWIKSFRFYCNRVYFDEIFWIGGFSLWFCAKILTFKILRCLYTLKYAWVHSLRLKWIFNIHIKKNWSYVILSFLLSHTNLRIRSNLSNFCQCPYSVMNLIYSYNLIYTWRQFDAMHFYIHDSNYIISIWVGLARCKFKNTCCKGGEGYRIYKDIEFKFSLFEFL